MKYYAGLDISMEATAVCVLDAKGRVIREASVASTPAEVIDFLVGCGLGFERIGLEACPLSEWLYESLASAGFPVVCLETRHLKGFLKSQINKTDRNDASGIAQAVRVDLFKPVHVKTLASRKRRALLSGRRLLGDQIRQVENHLRGMFKAFGLKVGAVSRKGFEGRVVELAGDVPDLQSPVSCLLQARRVLLARFEVLDRAVTQVAGSDPICRRLMTVPGVGPVVALTYRSAMDAPARFVHSRTVGAYFGLTPKRYQSGETDYSGRISKIGDREVRCALFEAANVLLRRSTRPCALKSWGMGLSRRRGRKKAVVAVARKLAAILHRLWVSGEDFRWGNAAA